MVALAQPKTRRRTHGVGGPATTSREARLYNLQNWRADVVVTTDANGVPVDHTRYNAYGVARKVNVSLADVASDGLDTTYNPNGSVGPEDLDAFTAAFIAGNVAMADVASDSLDRSRKPNGSVGAEDQDAFIAAYIAGTGTTVKRGVLESGGIDSGLGGNRFGYAGYELDPALRGVESGTITQTMYHVRNRVYDAENGRWTRRDPLGYVDGMGLYEYCQGRPEELMDEMGLACGGSQDSQEPVIIYPNYPSDGACARWANAFCNSRLGSYNSNCHNQCRVAALDKCRDGTSQLEASNAGVAALARCNTAITNKDRWNCYSACVNASSCDWICDECMDGFDIRKVLAGCILGLLPTNPALVPRSPYNPSLIIPVRFPIPKLIASCLRGYLVVQTGLCSACIGCMLHAHIVCNEECYLKWK